MYNSHYNKLLCVYIYTWTIGNQSRYIKFTHLMKMGTCNANPQFSSEIVFADEATLYLNGSTKFSILGSWTTMDYGNYYTIPPESNSMGWKWNHLNYGNFFYWANTLKNNYIITVPYPNDENPHISVDSIWFQHDRAPPHYSRTVWYYFRNIFPNR